MQILEQNSVIQEARIVYFSVASTPMIASQAQDVLLGKNLTQIASSECISECKNLIQSEIQTMADLTNSVEMKSHLMGVLIERALKSFAA
jgi:carbon-monoxide dehydrogenase medium subunit